MNLKSSRVFTDLQFHKIYSLNFNCLLTGFRVIGYRWRVMRLIYCEIIRAWKLLCFFTKAFKITLWPLLNSFFKYEKVYWCNQFLFRKLCTLAKNSTINLTLGNFTWHAWYYLEYLLHVVEGNNEFLTRLRNPLLESWFMLLNQIEGSIEFIEYKKIYIDFNRSRHKRSKIFTKRL